MVHVSATAVESIPNDTYSIHVIIMIVACCIRFPANNSVASRCKTAFGDMYMFAISIFMLNWFRIIYIDAKSLISD